MGLFNFGKKNNIISSVSTSDNTTESSYNDIPDYSGYCPDCPICGKTMGYNYVESEFKCLSCGYIMDEFDWDYKYDFDDPGSPHMVANHVEVHGHSVNQVVNYLTIKNSSLHYKN